MQIFCKELEFIRTNELIKAEEKCKIWKYNLRWYDSINDELSSP